MSIRLSSYTDRLNYNATPPPPAPDGFTVTGWIYASAAAGEDGYTVFHLSSDHSGVINSQFLIGTQLNENDLGIITIGGGEYVTDLPISVGQWYWFAARIGALGVTNEAEIDLGVPGNFTIEHFSRGPVDASGTPTDIWVGGEMPNGEDTFWNGRLAYLRVWASALSDAEVLAEVQSPTPQRTTDLWADWPLLTAEDLTDHSGQGHDLVPGTTAVTTEDNPPISAAHYTPTITDDVDVHDVASDAEARVFHGLVLDQLGLTDDVATARLNADVVDDAVGLTDDTVVTRSAVTVASSSVGLTDDVTASIASTIVVTSAIGIHESMTTRRDLASISDDAVGLTDAVVVVLARHRSAVVTSPIGLTDQVVPARDAQLTLTSAISIFDVASDVDARVFHGLVIDAVGLTDEPVVLFQRHFITTATDAIGITDVVDTADQLHEVVESTVGISDTVDVEYRPEFPTYGACHTWEPRWVCDVSCESPAATAQAAAFATDVVWALSGRQFGFCQVTLRPCREDCATYPWPNAGLAAGYWSEWPGNGWLGVSLIGGQWFNIVCGRCTAGCSCTNVSEIRLPAPVMRILEVRVDGVVLPTTAYRLDDARLLVRIDGDEWPRCNDLNLNDDQPGTWSVTAEYGREIPEAGRWAVGELACQLLRARGGEDCLLPANVTQLIRQGVTITMPNAVELLRDRLTNLYLVNLFIATYNPHRLARRSAVYSVDRIPARRTGT